MSLPDRVFNREIKRKLPKWMWPLTRKAGPSAGQAGTFHEIYLIGPAKMVFEGALEL
jgi:hypothetical protein